MSIQEPKTFFKKLKDTCKKIDQNVNEVKEKLYRIDLPADEELAFKKVSAMQDQIKSLKKEATDLKFVLEPKLAHTSDFIQHFKELTAETEVLVTTQENYLQQYGYKPLEMATESATGLTEAENIEASPMKLSPEVNEIGSTTPSLLDYGIVSNSSSGPSSNPNDRKSSLEDFIAPEKVVLSESVKSQAEKTDSTPTLEININAEKETPPVPGSYLQYIPALPATPTLVL